MPIITALKCLLCNDLIYSKHRHDYVSCSCGSCSIDGGRDYTKISYTSKKDYELVDIEEKLIKNHKKTMKKLL